MTVAEGETVTALVLAGRRDGALDPLAAAAGTALKCLVPVAARPMIVHVVEALAATRSVRRIIVSTNDGEAVAQVPEIRALIAQGMLGIVPAHDNLVDSVAAALAGAQFPVLVTTADNVLLGPDSIAAMAREARGAGADVAVAFTRREAVLAAHPDGQRRFYHFADAAYSNCNTYWLGRREALAAAEVFRRGGQFAKHPWRIVRAFGLINLIRFRYGIGTLDAAFRRFSRRFRLTIAPVVLADGAVAIDVDNARTLGIAEQLLHARDDLALAAE